MKGWARTTFALAIFWTALPVYASSTLRVVINNDLTILDPIWTTAYTTRDYGYLVYDTLFDQDADLNVKPQMVERWSVTENDTLYTFTLRNGLKWHDGSPVTSTDCIASLKRWFGKDATASLISPYVLHMEELSATVFTIKLSRSVGAFLATLAKSGSNVAFMMPKKVAETGPATQISSSIGSGPFIFKRDEWRPGSKIVFVKNSEYIPREESANGLSGGKRALVDRIEWIVMPDAATSVNALRAGEVDMIQETPFDLIPILEKDKEIILDSYNAVGNQGLLRMNQGRAPFNNLKLRRALAQALDQKDLLEAAIGDPKYFRPCAAMFGCGAPFATDAGGKGLVQGNLASARALLSEAGYDGSPVTMLVSSNRPIFLAFSEVAAEALRKVGFIVDMKMMEWNQLVSSRAQRDGWSIFISNLSGSDIVNPLSNFAVTGSCNGGFPGWSCDDTLEELRKNLLLEDDKNKASKLSAKIQERAYQNLSYVPLGQYMIPAAYRRNVSGVVRAPVLVFWNISKR